MKRIKVKKDRSGVTTKAFKTEVTFSESDTLILDGQSKIINWIYNHMLDVTIKDYNENNNALKLSSGYNCRDYFVDYVKPNNQFTKSVYSMVAAFAATSVKESFDKFFKRGNKGFPKFSSWKENWRPLVYEAPNTQGVKIFGNQIRFALGKDENGKQMYVTGQLNEMIKYPEYKLNTVTLKKERFKSGDKFFVSFSCDIPRKRKTTENKEKWCSIDPNHKNMFVLLDYNLNTFEFSTIKGIKDIDKEIDKVQGKLDVCRKGKVTKKYDKNGDYIESVIIEESKRYKRLAKALVNLRNKRREQIKTLLYTIANFLCKNYDYIIIGDYTPSINVTTHDRQNRSMLNQTFIGKFRRILKEVCDKSYKKIKIVNEKDTTATCCSCSDYKKKGPEIREFTCPVCNVTLNRDVNSTVNIARKGGVELHLSGTDYLTIKKVKYNVLVSRRKLSKELSQLKKHMKTTKRGSEVGKTNV
jgi:putative transposase